METEEQANVAISYVTQIAVVRFSASRVQSVQVCYWIQLARVVTSMEQMCFGESGKCVRAGEESKFYLMEIVVIKEKDAQLQVESWSMKLRG